jgi:hypothetical protein
VGVETGVRSVGVIGFNEKALQEQARELGGSWDRERQLWFVRYGCIAGTKLEKLIDVETITTDKKAQKFIDIET